MSHNIIFHNKKMLKTTYIFKRHRIFFNSIFGHFQGLRLFGIGFGVYLSQNKLNLKLGFSNTIINDIPINVKIQIKNDERKKPNILWLFSKEISNLKTYINIIKNYKKISPFVRKRITGLLSLNELTNIRLKKWKNKKNKKKTK